MLRATEIKSNLTVEPASSLSLIGRDQDIEHVYGMLIKDLPPANGHVVSCSQRLVMMTGYHGVGKSSLARAVCHRLLTPTSVTSVPDDKTLIGGLESATGHAQDGNTTGARVEGGSVYDAVVLVECRGCDGTRESLLARLFGAFDLPYRARLDDGRNYPPLDFLMLVSDSRDVGW